MSVLDSTEVLDVALEDHLKRGGHDVLLSS